MQCFIPGGAQPRARINKGNVINPSTNGQEWILDDADMSKRHIKISFGDLHFKSKSDGIFCETKKQNKTKNPHNFLCFQSFPVNM